MSRICLTLSICDMDISWTVFNAISHIIKCDHLDDLDMIWTACNPISHIINFANYNPRKFKCRMRSHFVSQKCDVANRSHNK